MFYYFPKQEKSISHNTRTVLFLSLVRNQRMNYSYSCVRNYYSSYLATPSGLEGANRDIGTLNFTSNREQEWTFNSLMPVDWYRIGGSTRHCEITATVLTKATSAFEGPINFLDDISKLLCLHLCIPHFMFCSELKFTVFHLVGHFSIAGFDNIVVWS